MGAPGISRLMIRRIFFNSSMRLTLVWRRPAVSTRRISARGPRGLAGVEDHRRRVGTVLVPTTSTRPAPPDGELFRGGGPERVAAAR